MGPKRKAGGSKPSAITDKAQRLIEIVRRFRGRRVAVLADLVSDEFVFGDIERISREAPVLILRHRKTVVVPGCGGNAITNLKGLGARPIPVGLVGKDSAGRGLIAEFKRLRIPATRILVQAGYETPSKSRVLALRKAGKPVLVDSRSRVALYRGVTACTPNQEEVERASQLPPFEDSAALNSAARKLLRETGNRAMLLTRGSRGMNLYERGRRALSVPAYGSDEVADVTGAGDTVIAVFTLAVIAGAGFADAARLSNYAAGLVVLKMGTATISPDELIRAIRESAGEL